MLQVPEFHGDGVSKKLLCKTTEVTKLTGTVMWVYHVVIQELYACITEYTVQKVYNTRTIVRALFKATTCLYVSPNDKARNLSTLIAVIVNKDMPQRRHTAMILVKNEL